MFWYFKKGINNSQPLRYCGWIIFLWSFSSGHLSLFSLHSRYHKIVNNSMLSWNIKFSCICNWPFRSKRKQLHSRWSATLTLSGPQHACLPTPTQLSQLTYFMHKDSKRTFTQSPIMQRHTFQYEEPCFSDFKSEDFENFCCWYCLFLLLLLFLLYHAAWLLLLTSNADLKFIEHLLHF